MSNVAATMKLNHLSFPCQDVEASAAFFEQQLGCCVTPFGSSRLAKRLGFDIVLEDAATRVFEWPENFHFGFELASVDDVQCLHASLRQVGVDMKTDVFHHPRGSRFFCRAPGGLMIEVNTRSDADELYRGSFS